MYVARVYRLTATGRVSILTSALLETVMSRPRGSLSVVLSFLLSSTLLIAPVWGSSPSDFAVVVFAERASVGAAGGSVGSTVFAGDRLGTDPTGTLQVRAGAARFVLRPGSNAVWGVEGGIPVATLTRGTAVMSTANAKAFALRVATAVFRPRGDEPTIGSVTYLNPKELVVRCSRGALMIAVDNDVRVVPEGSAYHVVLDPNGSVPPGASPAAASAAAWGQHQPVPPGRSKFIWYAIGFVALVTAFAISEACESEIRP